MKVRVHPMKFVAVLLVALTAFCSACRTDGGSKEAAKPEASEGKISIYMYEDFPSDRAEVLENELRRYFPQVELVEERRSLPQSAFVAGRNRYRGTRLLDDLRPLHSGGIVLGLTDRIICTGNELSPDFGIMGISYLNSGLAVVSSKVPKTGKSQTSDNLLKLALHEIGHACGLPHCSDQKCYMVDAEHRMKFPQTTGFCPDCLKALQNKGIGSGDLNYGLTL